MGRVKDTLGDWAPEGIVLQSIGPNKKGRDIAVGDVHGHFTKLQEALDAIDFDPEVDRLFIVGDLVDRGPESHLAREWLKKPWVFAVRGNHDGWVIQKGTNHHFDWVRNGGGWFQKLSDNVKKATVKAFEELPIAIEVMTKNGLVGIVHADIPFATWSRFREELCDPESEKRFDGLVGYATWSRHRIIAENQQVIGGIEALVVGHSTVESVLQLGNVYYIDTGGWIPNRGHFTLFDLNTLQVYKEPEHGQSISEPA